MGQEFQLAQVEARKRSRDHRRSPEFRGDIIPQSGHESAGQAMSKRRSVTESGTLM